MVEIVWDEPKRLRNKGNHSLDFSDLTLAFFGNALIEPAKQSRFKATGRFHGDLVAVIFAPLGAEAISVISMRRASRKERRLDEQTFSAKYGTD